MPLPTASVAWPPKDLSRVAPKLTEWDAWWSGDPDRLAGVYGRTGHTIAPSDRPSQHAGGVVGAVSRMFWGRPRADLTKAEPARLHLPIAADIAQASADLLFSDGPVLVSDDPATQAALDAYVEDGLVSQFAQSAEIGAALGSTYLRVVWDEDLSPRPFLSPVDADAAHPEFKYGRLIAVTFWWVVRAQDNRVWRHLERHELTPTGEGVILHGLYEGDLNSLGSPRPLTDIPALAGIAASLDADQAIYTGSPGLAVAHVPNQLPSRVWRNDPVGRHLGRSDFDGIEQLMDALDQAWSSWMRDVELGKGRILATESVLDDNGPGRGASFDLDRTVFTPLNMLQSRESSGLPIEVVQFQIRVAEHEATCDKLLAQILRTAGYSAQTFGEGGADAAMTATEVASREQRSLLTRDRKLRAWRPAVTQIVRKLLTVEAVLLGGGALKPETATVAFADAIQETPLELAQTSAAWRAAQGASTKTIVAYLHPDWDEARVNDEVAAILGEQAGTMLPDPTTTVPPGA